MKPKVISRYTLLRTIWYAVGAATVSGPALWWYGTVFERGMLQVVPVRVRLPRLPRPFAGLKVAQISDLHFGPLVSAGAVRAAVDTVLGLKPDLAVVTGDHVSTLDHGEADLIVQELSRLNAPFGAFAVLGNHDHWTNPEVVANALRRAGLTLLRNASVRLDRAGETLYLAGVDDVWEKKHDLGSALAGVPDEGCAILLAHEPDFADDASKDRRVTLQLSGHSHGGQVRIPGRGPIRLPHLGQRYPEGLRQVGSMQLYTNRGIGVIFPPVRFNCRPEVTLFELASEG